MEKQFLKIISQIFILFLFYSCNFMEPGFSVLKGNYSYQLGKFQQATVSYLKGLESKNYEERIYYNMGNVFFSLGESSAALEVWSNAESTVNLDLRYRLSFNKGVLYYQLGKYRDASVMFKKALIANPASLDAKINLELTLVKLASRVSGTNSHIPDTKGGTNPVETVRMLEYIKRKEGQLWFSSQKESENNTEDW